MQRQGVQGYFCVTCGWYGVELYLHFGCPQVFNAALKMLPDGSLTLQRLGTELPQNHSLDPALFSAPTSPDSPVEHLSDVGQSMHESVATAAVSATRGDAVVSEQIDVQHAQQSVVVDNSDAEAAVVTPVTPAVEATVHNAEATAKDNAIVIVDDSPDKTSGNNNAGNSQGPSSQNVASDGNSAASGRGSQPVFRKGAILRGFSCLTCPWVGISCKLHCYNSCTLHYAALEALQDIFSVSPKPWRANFSVSVLLKAVSAHDKNEFLGWSSRNFLVYAQQEIPSGTPAKPVSGSRKRSQSVATTGEADSDGDGNDGDADEDDDSKDSIEKVRVGKLSSDPGALQRWVSLVCKQLPDPVLAKTLVAGFCCTLCDWSGTGSHREHPQALIRAILRVLFDGNVLKLHVVERIAVPVTLVGVQYAGYKCDTCTWQGLRKARHRHDNVRKAVLKVIRDAAKLKEKDFEFVSDNTTLWSEVHRNTKNDPRAALRKGRCSGFRCLSCGWIGLIRAEHSSEGDEHRLHNCELQVSVDLGELTFHVAEQLKDKADASKKAKVSANGGEEAPLRSSSGAVFVSGVQLNPSAAAAASESSPIVRRTSVEGQKGATEKLKQPVVVIGRSPKASQEISEPVAPSSNRAVFVVEAQKKTDKGSKTGSSVASSSKNNNNNSNNNNDNNELEPMDVDGFDSGVGAVAGLNSADQSRGREGVVLLDDDDEDDENLAKQTFTEIRRPVPVAEESAPESLQQRATKKRSRLDLVEAPSNHSDSPHNPSSQEAVNDFVCGTAEGFLMRKLDDLIFCLSEAIKKEPKKMQKLQEELQEQQRVMERPGIEYSAIQLRRVRLLVRGLQGNSRLLTELDLARKFSKLPTALNVSLYWPFTKAAKEPQEATRLAGILDGQRLAARSLQLRLRELGQHSDGRGMELFGDAQGDMRHLYTDPARPVFRPFVSSEQLRALRSPTCPSLKLLRNGDVLHVPFTQEECRVVVSVLGKEPLVQFEERLAELCRKLPWRTSQDILRFLERVEKFATESANDPMMRKVVVFKESDVPSLEEWEKETAPRLVQLCVRDEEASAFAPREWALQRVRSLQVPNLRESKTKSCRIAGSPVSCRFSPAGARYQSLVVGSAPSFERQLLLFQLEGRDGPKRIGLAAHGDESVTETLWTADGSYVVSSGMDRTIRVWDPVRGAQRQACQHNFPVRAMQVSRASERLAVSAAWVGREGDFEQEVKIWNVETGALQLDITAAGRLCEGDERLNGFVETVQFFGPSDAKVVLVTHDSPPTFSCGEARVLDVETGRTLTRVWPHRRGLDCLGVAPCRTIFATGSKDQHVAIVDCRNPEPSVRQLMAKVRSKRENHMFSCVSFSPDGDLIMAGGNDNLCHVWDLRWNGEPAMTLRHPLPSVGVLHEGDINSEDLQGVYCATWCAMNPRLLATGGEDGCVRCWDVSRSEQDALVTRLRGHLESVSALDMLPDGSAIASAGDDFQLTLYTCENGPFELGQPKQHTFDAL